MKHASLAKVAFAAFAFVYAVAPSRSSAIPFQDDFSGTLSRWEVVKGTWEIQGGELHGLGHGGDIDA